MNDPCWARHLPVYVRDTKQGHERIWGIAELLQINDDLLPEPTLNASGIEGENGSTLGFEAYLGDFRLAREAVEQYRSEARSRLLKTVIRAAENGLKTVYEERERIKAGLEDLEWLMSKAQESRSGFQYPACPRPEDCTGPCTRAEVCTKVAQVRTMLRLKWKICSEVISNLSAGAELGNIRKKLQIGEAAAQQAVELRRLAVEKNIIPDDFGGQKTLFYDWCGEKLKCGRTNALNKLKDWGIYIKGRKGKRGDKLGAMIQRLKSGSFLDSERFQSKA